VAAASIGVLLVLLVALALVRGFGIGVSDDDDASPSEADVQAIDERIVLDDDRDGFLRPQQTIDGLVDGDVRLLRVEGLTDDAAGTVRQCAAASGGACAPSIPMQADRRGRATFLFEFRRDVGGADCASAACVIVIDDGRSGPTALPVTFGAERRPGAIRLDRRRQLAQGEVLEVRLIGFGPGPTTVTYCTPPGPSDRRSCGAPAPEVVVQVGVDGIGSAPFPVYVGAVGRTGDQCRRGDDCAVAVPQSPDVAVVEVGFAGSADAAPGGLQLAIGLTVAAVLLAAAAVAIRRGGWTPPGGDPFAGIDIDDPFADVSLDDDPQPATSRRTKANDPAATTTTT
jgi:hypothetical protein